jgi:excisionase family DNA binding protein
MTTEYASLPSTTIWNSVEAAEYLRIHPRTLKRMARNGEIPSIQIGRLWRFRQSDLDAWLTRKVNSGPLCHAASTVGDDDEACTLPKRQSKTQRAQRRA